MNIQITESTPLSEDVVQMLDQFDKAVPRYTSYPPATLFNKSVTEETYKEWLSEIKEGTEVSLYVHLPFCKSLCLYCGCNMKVTQSQERMENYMQTLFKEIDEVRKNLSHNVVVTHLHFGGGTPTYMPVKQLDALFSKLKDLFTFSDTAELSVEIDPRICDEAIVECLVRNGVNRVSLGVQDFDENVQQAISRIQPYSLVKECVDLLRHKGLTAINFDLIYGLPNQTASSIQETLSLVERIKPSRISLFGYAHVPWIKKHQKVLEQHYMPNRYERYTLSEQSRQMLLEQGYKAVGIDHFALPNDPLVLAQEAGNLHRNFQGYTTDTAEFLIGFGASSISQLPQGMVQNNPQLVEYETSISRGELATIHGYSLTLEDIFYAEVVKDLMCHFKTDIQQRMDEFSVSNTVKSDVQNAINDLLSEDLITYESGVISTQNDKRLFVRTICAELDPHFQPVENRHAQAV